MADGEITGTTESLNLPKLPNGKTDWAAFAKNLTEALPPVTVKRGGVNFATGGIVVNSTGANPTIVQSAGPITPELWKHPENATREQLIEMVLKQQAWLKRQRKKSSEANAENEKLRYALSRVRHYIYWTSLYLGSLLRTENLSFGKRAAEELHKAAEAANSPFA